jgi:hypothetical protein
VLRIRRLAALAALLVAWAAAGEREEPAAPHPEPGARALLAGAETARAVVVGRVRSPGQLDLSGWRATLRIERTLHGEPAPGTELVIGWEELASKRPARFSDGARVLVALEPLPPGSLWSQRFPRRDALAVAARGAAFLRDPDAGTLEPLASWLALAPDVREQAPGVGALTELAARGEPPVAASALARLARIPGLAERLSEAGREALARLCADAGRPAELRRQALDLVARRELRALEPAVAALAAAPSPVQGAAVDALGRLRGGFPPERSAALLRSQDPAVRAAAARRAGAGLESAALRKLLAGDPAGEVRAAAAEALAAREGAGASEALIAALRETDPILRGASMRALADVGPEAVPALRTEIWETSAAAAPDRLAGAVLTLALLGADGHAELVRVSHEHPSPQIRRLAELALGRLEERH